MNLYLITQEENDDWDTYDSAVVAAETEENAKKIHPGNEWGRRNDWASGPENVTAKLIGIAVDHTFTGVICSSFNAA